MIMGVGALVMLEDEEVTVYDKVADVVAVEGGSAVGGVKVNSLPETV